MPLHSHVGSKKNCQHKQFPQCKWCSHAARIPQSWRVFHSPGNQPGWITGNYIDLSASRRSTSSDKVLISWVANWHSRSLEANRAMKQAISRWWLCLVEPLDNDCLHALCIGLQLHSLIFGFLHWHTVATNITMMTVQAHSQDVRNTKRKWVYICENVRVKRPFMST